MNTKQILPIEIRDIDDVCEWYEDQKKAIFAYQDVVKILLDKNRRFDKNSGNEKTQN